MNTKQDLTRLVQETRNEVENLKPNNVSEWLENQPNVEAVITTPAGNWLGAEVLTAGGAPTVMVNTRQKTVTGTWGGNEITFSFRTSVLDDYLKELYG